MPFGKNNNPSQYSCCTLLGPRSIAVGPEDQVKLARLLTQRALSAIHCRSMQIEFPDTTGWVM